jgi:glycosyltransferase involved in cell wall biosynthesis
MSAYPQPPQIASHPRMGSRPFWSVMIPTYNRTAYLERTLRGVLCQDPGVEEMQIEVVDDASTMDDPEPLVQQVCGDRVSFVRQPRNVGGVANWNACIERSVGKWIHILHSDDVVFPGFYARLKDALEARDDVGAAFCRHAGIDEADRRLWTSELETPVAGILDDFIEKIGVSQRINCPSIVVRRAVYEALGGFRPDLSFTPDWEMWIRIASRYPIWYEPTILAGFRSHSGSWTAANVRSALTIVDSRRCIEIVRPFLPPARAEIISRRARELASLQALWFAHKALIDFDFKTAFKQVWGGLKCSCSPSVIKALAVLPVRIARDWMRRAYSVSKRRFARAGNEP